MTRRWVESAAFILAVVVLRLLAATWRFQVRQGGHLRAARESGAPLVFALWHSRILPLLYHHRHQGIVMLVSRHRDGGYLTRLGARWGFPSVRGSSGRGGDVGLLGVVRTLGRRAEVAITPDGPRGPAERVKPGIVAAAQHTGALLVPVGARTAWAWWFRSWDRFCVPRPFARIEVVYGEPFAVPPGKPAAREAAERLQRQLHAVTHGP